MKKALLYVIITTILSAKPLIATPSKGIDISFAKPTSQNLSESSFDLSFSTPKQFINDSSDRKSLDEKGINWNPSEIVAKETVTENILNLTAKSAFLMDQQTKTPLFSYNEEEKLPIASMCKIMTLLLAFQEVQCGNLSMDEHITVSQNASSMGGSQVFLRANEEYLVSDLLKSIIISSANDSCVAIAERISGSTDCFVEEMNRKAAELGMQNTVFTNCTGLPKPGQFSSAKDVALMLSELLNYSEYYRFSTIWMDKLYHKDGTYTELCNTNKLIRALDGCDGGKTGFTQEAKFCLAATASRENLRLVSVIIGAEDSKTRFKENANLINYGFANYKNEKILSTDTIDGVFCQVKGGKNDCVSVSPQKEFFRLTQRGKKTDIQSEITLLKCVKAPVKQGQVVGKITLHQSGVAIGEIPLVANKSVAKKSFFDALREISRKISILTKKNYDEENDI